MVLVVLGHCTYYDIHTDFGGIYYGSQMKNMGIVDTNVHCITSLLTKAIYSFHMPLFMALAGAVFAIQLQKGKYLQLSSFIWKKANRLLLPFIIVSVFWSMPLKLYSDYWSASKNFFYDFVVGQLLIQGNTHLWFLPTLFCEFVLFWILFKWFRMDNHTWLLVTILTCFHFIGILVGVKIFSYVMGVAIYFYCGYLFERKRNELNEVLTGKKILLISLMWCVLFVVSCFSAVGFINKLIHHVILWLTALAGMLAFYGFCYRITLRNGESGYLSWLSKKSMGIYLYSDPLNYLCLSVFVGGFSLFSLGDEYAALMLYILRFIGTFIIAIFVIEILSWVRGHVFHKDIVRSR